MWICPVCEKDNRDGMLCRQCGFDQSANYRCYPTLTKRIAPIQSHAYRPKVLRSELTDSKPLQCPRCQSDKLVVYAREGIYVCSQCQNIIQIDAAHKVDRSPSPKTERNAQKNEPPKPVERAVAETTQSGTSTDDTTPQATGKSPAAKKLRKIVALSALLAVVVIAVLIFFENRCSLNYNKASSLYAAGEYEEARTIFESLGYYKNSADMAKRCDYDAAYDLYNNGNYSEAKAIFESLGYFSNSAGMVKYCDYKTASDLYDSGNYSKANAIFESLGDYEDSADMAKRCDYMIARNLYHAEEYEEALAIFESLGSFSNSDRLVKRCRFSIAFDLYYNGEYGEAKAIFESLGNYGYSAGMAEECANRLR